MHQAALRDRLAVDGNLDELVAGLHRLRQDAQHETHRQLREAMADPTDASRGRATAAAYEEWFATASDPGHVAAVSAHFLECWNAALRLRRGTGEER